MNRYITGESSVEISKELKCSPGSIICWVGKIKGKKFVRNMSIAIKKSYENRFGYTDEFRKKCVDRYIKGESSLCIAKEGGCRSSAILMWVKKIKGKEFVREVEKNSDMLNKLSETEKAYIAGIVDGEGSIAISKSQTKKYKYVYHILTISVSNTNKIVIDWLREKLGGSVHSYRCKAHRRDCFSWQTSAARAKKVLEQILPYLIIKKEASELAIEFQKRKKLRIKVDKIELDKREEYRIKIRNLSLFRKNLFLEEENDGNAKTSSSVC
jgi:hypothetical protein